MTRLQSLARRWLAAAGCTLLLAAVPTAQAGPLSFFSFEGEGNVLVFDAAAGTGGWNGRIAEFQDPAMPIAMPLALASLVTFNFDAAANQLTGQFEFTNETDLSSSVYGTLSGAFNSMASLASGGQFGLDYMIQGGTGQFADYRGFGLSFLTFDPSATGFNNYSEQGLLVASVPEPSALWLAALGLVVLAWAPRRRQAAVGVGVGRVVNRG